MLPNITHAICLLIEVFQKAGPKSIKVSIKCKTDKYLLTKSQNGSLRIKSVPLASQQEQMHESEQEGEMTG